MDLNPGPAVFNVSSTWDHVFVIKLDPAGNFLWAKRMGGNYNDDGFSLTTDASNNVYVTGFYSGIIDFDPGPNIFNLVSYGLPGLGSLEGFVQKLDANGNFVWAENFGTFVSHFTGTS